jgi:hypothetical protein
VANDFDRYVLAIFRGGLGYSVREEGFAAIENVAPHYQHDRLRTHGNYAHAWDHGRQLDYERHADLRGPRRDALDEAATTLAAGKSYEIDKVTLTEENLRRLRLSA